MECDYSTVNHSVAVQSTRLLRESDDLLYTRLRELLGDHAVDPKVSVLADLFPDDGHMEQGYIVTPDRRVFAFELHYGKGDLKNHARTAFLWNWNDITDVWAWSACRGQIEDALRVLDQGI